MFDNDGDICLFNQADKLALTLLQCMLCGYSTAKAEGQWVWQPVTMPPPATSCLIMPVFLCVCVCVGMICSVYHLLLRVAFHWDIPSRWRECWSANGDKINACVIQDPMGSLIHMVEDRKWERVGSWRWTAQCRSNSDGVTGGLLTLEPFKTIADLYCVLHWLQKRKVWVSSISKVKVM